MKAWQWAALGIGAIIFIVVIEQIAAKPSTVQNPNMAAAGSLGAFLGGLFKGPGFTPVTAPTAVPNYLAPGTSGYAVNSSDYNFNKTTGSQYSAAMASTGEVASQNAGPSSSGSGGTTFGGGLTPPSTSDPLGVGTYTNPGFDVGTGGADFSA